MSTTPARAARSAAGVLAASLVLLPLTACSIGTDTLSCSTSGCTVTLSGDQAQVDVLGTSLSFGGVQDGRASLGVAGVTVSCAEGETVAAGSLSLTCTSVQADAVEVTASLG
ncbi:hypothetical protein [Geodermatophilus sp. DSM 44513]|uniref:hypothetical protein n=1 Tax=Geodermatophilus sp. DSM 44513 TaxID=1528104 RepID=UPI001289367E|nr:hypothetical protein [Geodermatophilus sp. DSM 44513]WNV75307.1 hypothetical protein RTG05_20370 [Geodermatophilus sp. DSM 44513]